MPQRQEASSPLVSLPDLPIKIMLQELKRNSGSRALRAACRGLAGSVSAASQTAELEITTSTGWQGLEKAFTCSNMTCKKMVVRDRVSKSWGSKPHPDNAVEFLLKSTEPVTFSIPGVRYLHINAGGLPCLLPSKLATLLPNLQTLSIYGGPGYYQYACQQHLQPLPYCSSLQNIIYTVCYDMGILWLPVKFHTPQELSKQLPNITYLKLIPSKYANQFSDEATPHIETMLCAWGSQLTKLELGTNKLKPQLLQQCSSLQFLAWHIILDQAEVFLPSSLTVLQIDRIAEPLLETILQLPFVRIFAIDRFQKRLKHDWSQHTCTWHKLFIGKLSFEDLSKLPLHSLKGDNCLIIQELKLPNPLLPSSLNNARRAAQCLSNANVRVTTLWDLQLWNRYNIQDQQQRLEADAASVELLQEVGRVLAALPEWHYSSYNLPSYLMRTKAMLKELHQRLDHSHSRHEDIEDYLGCELLVPFSDGYPET